MTQFSYSKFHFTSLTETTCQVGWNKSIEGNGAIESFSIKGRIIIPSVAKDYANNRSYYVTEIGMYSFRRCTKITCIILPDSLRVIRWDAFFYTSITRLMIPMSVQTLGNSCFSNVRMLKEIIFEAGSQLKTIEPCVFYEDVSLESISLPYAITQIGYNVFLGCIKLKEVHFCSCFDASKVSYPFSNTNHDVKIIVSSCYPSSLFSNITVLKEGARCSFNYFPDLKLCYHITQKLDHSLHFHTSLIGLLSFVMVK